MNLKYFFHLYIFFFFVIFPPVKQVLAEGLEPSGFYLLYTGNTFGELKPCGCAREEDQGGIERRQAYFKSIRAKSFDVLLLDTGDSFKEPSQQGKIKARYLLKSMNHMAYDAVALGDKDFIYGQDFLKSNSFIPWVATNMKLPEIPSIPSYKIISLKDGTKIAILSLAEPDLFYAGPDTGLKLVAPEEALKKVLPELIREENPDLIIAMTHMKKENALALLDSSKLDIIVNGHIEKETDTIDIRPVQRLEKLFVQAGPRGQKVGEIFINLEPNGKRTYRHQMIRLDSHIQFDPEMVELYGNYNREIEQVFLETLYARRNKSKIKVYATDAECKKCHAQAHTIWKNSRHGKAFATLKSVNKAFDPECLVCHTVGFNQTGGFVSENDSPELKNVQCETCHGPGLNHAKDPKIEWDGNAAEACMKCHVKNHSPRFNFEEYWSLIKH